jgi:hypothetical protein
MTMAEFRQAFFLAKENREGGFKHDLLEPFSGFGMAHFRPIVVTTAMVSELIRWQARQFNGDWDQAALQEIKDAGRRKFLIADPDTPIPTLI